jgi:ferrous iron transport protein B
VLGYVGGMVAPVFEPLGFGDWKPTVATALGLVAKEEVVATFGVLYNTDVEDAEDASAYKPIEDGFNEMSGGFGKLAAFSFMIFNLLCAPCFAAIGAIKREMNSAKWTWFAIGYQCGLAYAAALMVFQLGKVAAGAPFTLGTAGALLVLAGMIYMLVRPGYHKKSGKAAA